jgi:hypothetical protein
MDVGSTVSEDEGYVRRVDKSVFLLEAEKCMAFRFRLLCGYVWLKGPNMHE